MDYLGPEFVKGFKMKDISATNAWHDCCAMVKNPKDAKYKEYGCNAGIIID